MDVLRPFLIVALLAFSLGFLGYVAAAWPTLTPASITSAVSAPAADGSARLI